MPNPFCAGNQTQAGGHPGKGSCQLLIPRTLMFDLSFATLPVCCRELGESRKSHRKGEAVVILKGTEKEKQVPCPEAWEGPRATAGL